MLFLMKTRSFINIDEATKSTVSPVLIVVCLLRHSLSACELVTQMKQNNSSSPPNTVSTQRLRTPCW